MDLKTIVVVFVAAILGVVLVGSLADSNSVIVNDIDITNETLSTVGLINSTDVNTSMLFNLTNNNWVTNSIAMAAANGSILTAGTDFFVDYTIEAINFTNSSKIWENMNITGNNTGVNYSYYHDNYLNDSSSRTLVGLLLLLYVIGIVLMIADAVTKGSIIGLFKK